MPNNAVGRIRNNFFRSSENTLTNNGLNATESKETEMQIDKLLWLGVKTCIATIMKNN